MPVSYLICLPKARKVQFIQPNPDEKSPDKFISEYRYISPVTGLNAACMDTTSLVRDGHDFFDISDLRTVLKGSADKAGRGEYDDEFLIIDEKHKAILTAAVKKHNWVIKSDVGGEETINPFWIDWTEFFDAIRNMKLFDAANIPKEYAEWKLAKMNREEKEAEEYKAALEKAANSK